jgi:preprotein translocase subunit SecB
MNKTLKDPKIKIGSILLEKLFFEAFDVEKPDMTIDSKFSIDRIFSNNQKELKIRLTAKLMEKNPNPPVKIEVVISATFTAEGKDNFPLQDFAKINAPAILFPFLREVIADITMRSKYPPLLLNPANVYKIVDEDQLLES